MVFDKEGLEGCEHDFVLAYTVSTPKEWRETYRCNKPFCSAEIERERRMG